MDLGARLEFALGGVADPDEWEAADDDEQRALLEASDPELEDPLLSVRVVLIDQLVADDPAKVWATAQRLAGEGLDRDAVWAQLSIAFAQSLDEEVDDDGTVGWDEEVYLALLDRLPFPSIDTVQQVIVDAVADRVVVPTDELLAGALATLGYDDEDDVAWGLVEAAFDSIMSDDGALAAVVAPSGEGVVVVHVPSLAGRTVLTHELDDDEREAGVLMVSFDLAGFERLVDPVLAAADAAGAGDGTGTGDGGGDGAGVELETVYEEVQGLVGWRGPEGWLEAFPAGATLAVRHLGDDRVSIEALASPLPVDEGLVDEMLTIYDDAAAESHMPVTGEELILAWLARDRQAFAEPRPSLTALCQTAGLAWWHPTSVLHDLEQGVTERMALHLASVLPGVEDEEEAMTALAVLDLAERLSLGMEVEPERIDQALVELRDADGLVREIVIARYFTDTRSPDEATIFTEALLASATAANSPEHQTVARDLQSLATTPPPE